MLALAKQGVSQPLPAVARTNHFDIAANLAFIAQQQGNMVAAVAKVKPPPAAGRESRFALLAIRNIRQRGRRMRQQRAPGKPACPPWAVRGLGR